MIYIAAVLSMLCWIWCGRKVALVYLFITIPAFVLSFYFREWRFLCGAYFAIASIPFSLMLILKAQWRPNNLSSVHIDSDTNYTPLTHEVNKRELRRKRNR